MNLARNTLCLLAPLLISACAATQPDTLRDVVLVPEKEMVNVPKETLRPCDPIPRLREQAHTQSETLDALNRIMNVTSDCSRRKDDATQIIIDAFNIKN